MDGNEALVRRFIDEAFNQGRLEAIDELMSTDFVEHQHVSATVFGGREALKETVSMLRRAFSDFHLALEDTVSRGDTVWARLRATGTHDGPFMGRVPTRKRISITVIDVMRIEKSRIVEHWGVADGLGALRQIDGGGPTSDG